MADLGNSQGQKHEPMLVSRRLIYLNRLVGDNYISSAAKVQRMNPWRASVVFIAYVAIATDWVVKEVRPAYVSNVNNALTVRLKTIPFRRTEGTNSYWHNVTTLEDVYAYLMYGLYPEFMMVDTRYSEKTSLLTYNRPLPNEDLCDNVSSVYLTMRVVKTVPTKDNLEYTVSDRFSPFYPTVWAKPSIECGSPPTDKERKDTLKGSYKPSKDPINMPPASLLGTTREGRPLTLGNYLAGSRVFVKWKHQAAKERGESKCTYCHGYQGQGGYAALITMRHLPEYQALIEEMRGGGLGLDHKLLQDIINDQMIFLLDADAQPYTNGSFGICGEVRASNAIRVGDFTPMFGVTGDFGETTFVSVAVNFQSYNANKQTLTDVSLTWNINAAGIVYSSNIRLNTVCLDQEYHVVQLLIFGVMTAYYSLELIIYRGYKQRADCKLLRDPWVYMDVISIIFCLTAISLRVAFGQELENFLADTENALPSSDDIIHLVESAEKFSAVSSFGVLTMFARMVEVLSKTPFRVRVLEHTLRKALPAMFKYGSYMIIVMLSFVAFTTLHFSEFSAEFRDFPHALVSCVEMLFISTRPYDTVRQAFWALPFLFVYFMFAIISVQMFNAIINYSYNRKCEDMEPIYLKQLRDKKIRESQAGPRRNPWVEYAGKCMIKCRRCCCKKKKGSKQEENEEVAEKKTKSVAAQDDLTPAEREQVEKAKEKSEMRQKPDKVVSVVFYTVFVIVYNLFLFDNLDVKTNGKIMSAIRETVLQARVDSNHPTGESQGVFFNEIGTIYDVGNWMTNAFPEVLKGDYEEYVHSGPSDDFYDHTAHCIKSWNCILQLPENATSQRQQMVRITQRLQRRRANQGVTAATSSTTRGFLGGPAILPLRGPSAYLRPASAADPEWEDVTTEMNLNIAGDRNFCRRDASGGYQNNGGIVCLLDANLENLSQELIIMFENGFYSLNTSAIIVDFVTYNGNSDNVAYTRITFNLHPTGLIDKELYVYALRLIKMHRFSEGMGVLDRMAQVCKTAIQIRLFWGILYMIFLVISGLKMIYELRREMQRVKDNTWSKFAAFVRYFTTDVYHVLDLISFAISCVAVVIFMAWFGMQVSFENKINSFSEFINYVDFLSDVGILYTHLSAVNVLLTTWRYLKYLRVVPQVRNIYDTLLKAMPDILWFLCMLIMFFMGFVMFAHINFGARLMQLNTIMNSLLYNFKYLIGEFYFWDLYEISPYLAIAFFFPYLFLFNLFYLNVFFAIMDKNFGNKEVSGFFSFRKLLKPVFGRFPGLRWINWDDDLNMEEDPTQKKEKKGPPSRAARVRDKATKIREILESGIDAAGGGGGKKAKSLAEVLDKDDRIDEALRWTREEARRFVQTYKRLLQDKEDAKNEESFINKSVRKRIEKDLEREKEGKEEAERLKRYAIHVHEFMAMRDQETLAQYICCLESKIKSVTSKKRIVLADLYHLTAEAEKMRYTDEELWHLDGQASHVADEDKKQLPHVKGPQAVSLPSVPEESLGPQDIQVETSDQSLSAEKVPAQEEVRETEDSEKESAVKLRVTAADLNDQLAEFIND